MRTLEHEHPVRPDRVAVARAALISAPQAHRLAQLLALVADPARSRILLALGSAGELCVGDLALALDITPDAASYALRLLRTAGLLALRKQGRVVFYRLADGFPHQLVEHCLRQLLTISPGPGGTT
jgi:DNA-binding transcriptional ArsR family regulator